MTCTQGNGFKFGLTKQGIAIQYVVNTFSSHFAWLKLSDNKNCRKFGKYFYSLILQVKFFPL